MHFGNSAGNIGGSAVRRSVGHDSTDAMSKLAALLPNYMHIVQTWSEKCVVSSPAVHPTDQDGLTLVCKESAKATIYQRFR